MKKLILFLVFLIGCTSIYAQKESNEPCATDKIHFELLKKSEAYRANFESQNKKWQEYATKKQSLSREINASKGGLNRITIAFHNMGNGSYQTVDYGGIIDYLNAQFASANVEFCKAITDKNGDLYEPNQIGPTSLSNDNTFVTAFTNVVNPSATSIVPTSSYLNFYIIDAIIPGNVAGFAYLPSSHGSQNDGVYIRRNQLTIPISSKTLAHEVGHYLGLHHVFGICNPDDIDDLDVPDPTNPPFNVTNPCSCNNDNCLFNGDMICDTPPSMLHFNPDICTINSCHSDADIYPDPLSGLPNINPLTTDLDDDKTNFMDYGDCGPFHFTTGQYLKIEQTIDPIDGPRKSLLLTRSCENCTELDGCTFAITPLNQGSNNPAIENTAYVNSQVAFTSTATNCVNPNVVVTYLWQLTNADTNTSITQNTDGIFTMPNVTGNYSIALTVTSSSPLNCSETVSYDFQIIAETNFSSCINFPISDSDSDWDNAQWNRVSYLNGWNREVNNPSNLLYLANGSTRYLNVDPINDSATNVTVDGFEIIPTLSDPNFNTVTNSPVSVNGGSPLPIMRVGAKISIGSSLTHHAGDAYYSSTVLYPTESNCKFRVYYLGMAEFSNNSTPISFLNSVTDMSNDATFGILNQYHFQNPMANNQIAHFGTNETGLLTSDSTVNPLTFGPNAYSLTYNDFIFGVTNNSLQNTPVISGHRKMNEWKYIDVDYSEFVKLNPGASVTLTFFSRSNSGFDASKHAYAYYAIDCLGGGVPKNLILELPDLQLPCSPPDSDQSCHTYTINLPDNLINPHTFGTHNNVVNYNNLVNFSVTPISANSTAQININLPRQLGSQSYGFTICLESSDVPSEDFQVTFSTINQTITQTITVYYGYYYTIHCQRTDVPPVKEGTYDPDYPIHDVAYCPSNPFDAKFILTTPCIIPESFDLTTIPYGSPVQDNPYYYTWEIVSINGNNSFPALVPPNFSITLNEFIVNQAIIPFSNNCSYKIRRILYVKDYYCGGYAQYKSPFFTLYPVINTPTVTIEPLNICSNDNDVDVEIATVNLSNCSIPQDVMDEYLSSTGNTNVTGTLTLEILTPGGQSFPGTTALSPWIVNIPIDANGVPDISNATLTFNNVNTHGTSQTSDDSPYYTGNTQLKVRWTLNMYGCSIQNNNLAGFFINIEPSAFGGSITVANNTFCPRFDFFNLNNGVANGYTWQHSNDGSTWSNITSVHVDLSVNTGLSNPSLIGYIKQWPVTYVRRCSNAPSQTAGCNQPAYSNVILLDPQMPHFDNLQYACPDNPYRDLPECSINGVCGTWVLVTPIGQSPEQWQFNPFSLNCVPLGYENNPFIQTIEISPVGDVNCICLDNLTLNAADIPLTGQYAQIYRRNHWIVATDNYILSDDDNIDMHAEHYIDLLASDANHYTEYVTMHHFQAHIEECSHFPKLSEDVVLTDKIIIVVPNPTNGEAEIVMKNAQFNNVVITTIDGKIVLSKNIESNYSYKVDLSKYPQGIYIITVTADDGQLFNEKVIKN